MTWSSSRIEGSQSEVVEFKRNSIHFILCFVLYVMSIYLVVGNLRREKNRLKVWSHTKKVTFHFFIHLNDSEKKTPFFSSTLIFFPYFSVIYTICFSLFCFFYVLESSLTWSRVSHNLSVVWFIYVSVCRNDKFHTRGLVVVTVTSHWTIFVFKS